MVGEAASAAMQPEIPTGARADAPLAEGTASHYGRRRLGVGNDPAPETSIGG
jgi:hypothetical protein